MIFDCSGAALREGIKAAPTLVKPNLEELEQWAGRPIKTLSEQAECARALQAAGDPHVVISNGADGLVWFGPRRHLAGHSAGAWRWSARSVPATLWWRAWPMASALAGRRSRPCVWPPPSRPWRSARSRSVSTMISRARSLLEQVRVQRLDDLAPAQPIPIRCLTQEMPNESNSGYGLPGGHCHQLLAAKRIEQQAKLAGWELTLDVDSSVQPRQVPRKEQIAAAELVLVVASSPADLAAYDGKPLYRGDMDPGAAGSCRPAGGRRERRQRLSPPGRAAAVAKAG